MKQKIPILLLLAGMAGFLIWVGGCSKGPYPVPLKPGGLSVGDKAADFALMDNNGRVMKLSDVQEGWYLILILYRGHWCSACLNQLLNLKEDYPKFASLHAALAAISTDNIEDSTSFSQQWRFPYPLLSDTKLEVIDAYGARHPQGHEGKDIAHPAVIIIDSQKVVRYKYVGKNPADRPSNEEILFTLQQIQQQTAKH